MQKITISPDYMYQDEINYLSIKKLREWEYPCWKSFQYDAITDLQIQMALENIAAINQVNTMIDWEDDCFLRDSKIIPDDDKHAYRIAALVNDLKSNDFVLQNPIQLDTCVVNDCGFCIPNGHHRIRACEFLAIDVLPFSLSGFTDELDILIELADINAQQQSKMC